MFAVRGLQRHAISPVPVAKGHFTPWRINDFLATLNKIFDTFFG
jgi:hypothetical protein